MADRANSVLSTLGVANAMILQGPLEQGVPRQAPYNVIVIEGLADEVPPTLLGQLADGGRLVGVVRDRGVGRAMLFTRNGEITSTRVLFDASVSMLPGLQCQPGFVF